MSDDHIMYGKLNDAVCHAQGKDARELMQDEQQLYEAIAQIMHQMSVKGLNLYYPVSSGKVKYAFTSEADLQNFISLILARKLKQWINDGGDLRDGRM